MGTPTGADAIAEQLRCLGVRDVFGVGGANIEDLFAAVQRRRPEMSATLCKHEHGAGTAADAYARISGGVGVVMTTSGGAAMNVVSSLAEAYASRVPVLAIVGEPPRALQGHGAFQDTSGQGGTVDAARVLGAVSRRCERVAEARALPGQVREAWATALAHPEGPTVLLVSKDLQQARVDGVSFDGSDSFARPRDMRAATLANLEEALCAERLLVVAGDEVSRGNATVEFARLVRAVDADVCVTPDARDAFDNDDARFLGVIGAMGHARVGAALTRADAVLLVGTQLPLLARLGVEAVLHEKRVACLSRERPFVGTGNQWSASVSLASELDALVRTAGLQRPGAGVPAKRVPEIRSSAVSPVLADERLTLRSTMEIVNSYLPAGGVVLADAGNTGAGAAHYLRCPTAGRWLMAMGMAGMGYTFGAAIGAAKASGKRCFVLSGDGAFFMHGLEVHTAVQHALPITYVIVDNRAHGMCLVREHLLLGDNAGYNSFARASVATGLGAMFPNLPARIARTQGELQRAFDDFATASGPAVVSAELEDVEIPPFAAFAEALQRGVDKVSRSAAP